MIMRIRKLLGLCLLLSGIGAFVASLPAAPGSRLVSDVEAATLFGGSNTYSTTSACKDAGTGTGCSAVSGWLYMDNMGNKKGADTKSCGGTCGNYWDGLDNES
jgi:hypothetical protein